MMHCDGCRPNPNRPNGAPGQTSSLIILTIGLPSANQVNALWDRLTGGQVRMAHDPKRRSAKEPIRADRFGRPSFGLGCWSSWLSP